jgi:hypothetical protein
MSYKDHITQTNALIRKHGGTWDGISAESVARMRMQNQFRTGLDIARYTAAIMRKDMAAYDADPAKYTQSLGCWHGFIGQQKMISIKKHFGSTERRYLYLSGWMIAALRSDFGPLPDQSMHEKTSVPALIEELYTFLRQADARELGMMFRDIDAARAVGDHLKERQLLAAVDSYQTHVVPIIADIDAGFGNAEATYLLARKMIEAGACALQIENQVSDEKQCGHQDGKVTVPHEDFLAKLRACRYAFSSWASKTASSSPAPIHSALASPSKSPFQKKPVTSATSTTASSIARRSTPRRRATAMSSSTAMASCCARSASRRTSSSSAPDREKTAACSIASRRCRTAPTCCGSRPRNRTSSRSPAWLSASAKSFRMPSWCTTTRRRSTGR